MRGREFFDSEAFCGDEGDLIQLDHKDMSCVYTCLVSDAVRQQQSLQSGEEATRRNTLSVAHYTDMKQFVVNLTISLYTTGYVYGRSSYSTVRP